MLDSESKSTNTAVPGPARTAHDNRSKTRVVAFDWHRDDLPKPAPPKPIQQAASDRAKALADRLAPAVRRACELFGEAQPESYPDREWRRFLSVAVSTEDGCGWTDPTGWPDGRPAWVDDLMKDQRATGL